MLYEQTVRVLETFWEWRNKLLTLEASLITALIAAAGLLHTTSTPVLSLVAGTVGGIIGVTIALLDRRNEQILNHAFAKAKALEAELGGGGVFEQFPRKAGLVRYRVIVPWTGIIFGTASIAAGVFFYLSGS